ncbi:uncharacterized protein TNCV_2135471 [Trichonephila clavipes]|nr:uncharacterized protein TNCV_2135471 [Trichonephila clavipes]
MLIYELPASSLQCRAQPIVIRGSFEPYDQMLYFRTILEPHTAYPIPAGTNYIVLTVKKTAFALDIIPESLLPQLIQNGFHVEDFRKMTKKALFFCKWRSKARITPVIRRVSRRPELLMAPGQIPETPVPNPRSQESVQIPESLVPEPVQISDVPEPPVEIPELPVEIPDPPVPEPPVQIPPVPEPVQIPPEFNTLEPTDALDQLMSFVFGPPAQELRLLHTVPSIFDGDLISFLNKFER